MGVLPDPDQDLPRFISGHPFGINEVGLEVFQVVVAQGESSLEDAVRDPLLTLQLLPHLRQDLLKGHRQPPMYHRLVEDGVRIRDCQAIYVPQMAGEGKLEGGST